MHLPCSLQTKTKKGTTKLMFSSSLSLSFRWVVGAASIAPFHNTSAPRGLLWITMYDEKVLRGGSGCSNFSQLCWAFYSDRNRYLQPVSADPPSVHPISSNNEKFYTRRCNNRHNHRENECPSNVDSYRDHTFCERNCHHGRIIERI